MSVCVWGSASERESELLMFEAPGGRAPVRVREREMERVRACEVCVWGGGGGENY